MTRAPFALVLLAVLLAPPLRAQDAPPPDPPAADPFTAVLTRADLAAAGALRLGDLWTLLDGVRVASTDGFTHAVSAGGLAPLGADVLVLVDGQPVDAALFGTGGLEAVPLALGAVERVELTTVPTVAAGVFAPGGVLRIITRTPERGLGLRAGVGAGNETGDPGPFRYTPLITPNVDRVGPALWAEGGASGRAAFVAAGGLNDEHHATDVRIVDRVRLLYDERTNPRLFQNAAALRAGTAGGAHRLLAAYGRLDDLRYLPALGRELPLGLAVAHAGAAGTADGGLAYRLAFTRLDTDPRSNRAGLDLDWREDRLRAHVAGRVGTGRLGATVGAGVDHTRLVTARPVAPAARLLGRLGVTAHLRTPRGAAVLGAHGVAAGERLGLKALAGVTVAAGGAGTFALHASFARRLPEERRDLAGWASAGYRLPGADAAALAEPAYTLVGHTLALDAAWTARPTPALTLTARAGYRGLTRQTLVVTTFAVDALGPGFAPSARGVADAAGAVVLAEAGGAWRAGPRLLLRAHYSYTRPTADDAMFWTVWRPLPWHLAALTARAAPHPRLVLWARARLTGSAYWPAYAGAAAATDGRYDETLPATLALDAAVTKRFWGDHLDATVALRNALGATLRSHPGGAETHLGLYVALRARLGAG